VIAVTLVVIVTTRATVPPSIGHSWIAYARFSSASAALSRLCCCSSASSVGVSPTGSYASA
jgi:hypothetical protein